MKNNKLFKPLQISIYAGFIFLSIAFTPQAKAISANFIPEDSLNALRLVNNIRSQRNLDQLTWNDRLATAAQLKAIDMIQNNYFEHVSPSGARAWSFIEKADYSYMSAGENLAIDYNSVQEATKAWTLSQSHMANIVGDSYSEFGFAQITDSDGSKIYVQIFASPKPLYEIVLSDLANGKN